MLTDIQNGILVDQTLGVETNNDENGDFAAQVHLGYKIERGEIVGRVKSAVVTGNILDALSNLAFVGDEAFWVAGSSQVPYLCFHALDVTGTG